MHRVSITIDDELMTELDRIIAAHGYQSRSEVIRVLARAGIRAAAENLDQKCECVAALVYVYDHAAPQLPIRLDDTFHDHHELSLASMHANFDHDSRMEVTILRGNTDKVRRFAGHVIAEHGVRHGRVMVVPADAAVKPHSGGHEGHDHHSLPHSAARPMRDLED
jgi:CopG family transcriptional regulator, nickel-responsive regulator